MKKNIITVVGKDRVGIIAAVCSYLSAYQTIRNLLQRDDDQSAEQRSE